jgi:hypothetical protein
LADVARGWTLAQAAGLALAGFLAVRLLLVGLTFVLMLQGSERGSRQNCASARQACAWCSRNARQ